MKKILVVEDNGSNMYLVSFILKKNGYDVIEVINGEDAVTLVTKETPDLVIMDIQLPGIDGLEATKRIRESEVNNKIPILALTSYAMAGDKEKVLSAGCTGHIGKPINPETFIAEIEAYL